MAKAKFSFRMSGKGQVRAEVSPLSDFSSGNIFSPFVEPDPKVGWAVCEVTGLADNTQYFVRANYTGIASTLTGSFRTPPAGAHNFSFAFASCWNPARTEVGKFIFQSIRNKIAAGTLQFIIHTGDFQYADIQVEDTSLFRNATDPVFLNNLAPNRAAMFRECPVYYMYDDHDAGGPDNGNAFDPGTQAGIEFFRKATPNPDFAQPSGPPYYSFKRGRCRFVVTDVRNDRTASNQPDGPSKYMLSEAQYNWLLAEFAAANLAGEPVFWVSTTMWLGNTFSTGDPWLGYNRQRQEIASWIVANGMSNKIAVLTGDEHAMAYDNGTNSPGGIKCLAAAPWDQTRSSVPQPNYPYSTPLIAEVDTQYGQVDVTDTGSGPVTVRFRGFAVGGSSEIARIDQTFSLG